jgi:hypothetical protein
MSKTQTEAQITRWKNSQSKRIALWKLKASVAHKNKFIYDNVVYNNSQDKVKILCPEHGEFEQRAYAHLHQRQGCPKCSHNFPVTHEQFVFKSKERYNIKFTILSQFTGIKHPITIQCKDHGEFVLKKAENHLKHTGGCPTCWYLSRLENLKPGNISKVEKDWLDSLKVPLRQEKITVDNQIYLVDGFDPSTSTVYEYYGSFWHGNPEKYSPGDYNRKTNTTFGELYQRTLIKEQEIKKQYNLVTKWGP